MLTTNDSKANARLSPEKLDMNRSTNQLLDQFKETLKMSSLSTKFPQFSRLFKKWPNTMPNAFSY